MVSIDNFWLILMNIYINLTHCLLAYCQGVVGSGRMLCAKPLWSSLFLYFLLSPSFFSTFVVICDCWLFADFFSLSLYPFSRRALSFSSVRHPVLREKSVRMGNKRWYLAILHGSAPSRNAVLVMMEDTSMPCLFLDLLSMKFLNPF